MQQVFGKLKIATENLSYVSPYYKLTSKFEDVKDDV